ncbi:MAG: hypothetical protein A4S09_10180 [Proteobacteria bacterium SG_bin7]|nr:MAG: hypothetical protein A4S09_10180 [Proteobacteria bacterium SG_bin7]
MAESRFGSSLFTYIVSYLIILGIAFLTGFELPLIMNMANDPSAAIEILSYDFGGMFAATVLFPFFLLPELGIFATLNFCLILNLGSMLYVLRPHKFTQKIYACFLFTAIILGFVFNSQLISYFGKMLTD